MRITPTICSLAQSDKPKTKTCNPINVLAKPADKITLFISLQHIKTLILHYRDPILLFVPMARSSIITQLGLLARLGKTRSIELGKPCPLESMPASFQHWLHWKFPPKGIDFDAYPYCLPNWHNTWPLLWGSILTNESASLSSGFGEISRPYEKPWLKTNLQ